MISTYIALDKEKDGKINITRLEPTEYKVTELHTTGTLGYSDKWNEWSTHDFTQPKGMTGVNSNPDFKMTRKTDKTKGFDFENPFGVFINRRAVSTKGTNNEEIRGAFNIETCWVNTFPETIKLSYPGFSQGMKHFPDEDNYDFKVWEDSGSSLGANFSNLITGNGRVRSPDEYFYDLLEFMRVNSNAKYDEWIQRPSFSLKNLLGKTIANNGRMYQLYRINDINVQSLTTNFDEYIPWCFDQNGVKIKQHKIALISSFNRKEVYLLMEVRQEDISYHTDTLTAGNNIIPEISNIIFWRHGISNNEDGFKTNRSFDKNILMTTDGTGKKRISNISQYFRESKVESDTVVSFQKNRLDNKEYISTGDNRPVERDGDQVKENNEGVYDHSSNIDDGYSEKEFYNVEEHISRVLVAKDVSKNKPLNLLYKNFLLDRNNSNMLNVFVNGRFIDIDRIKVTNDGPSVNLVESPVTLVLDLNDIDNIHNTFDIEIFINSHNSPNVHFKLDDNKKITIKDVTQEDMDYLLYDNGLLWKTEFNKNGIIFNDGVYTGTSTEGNTLIINALKFIKPEDVLVKPEKPNDTKVVLKDFDSYRGIGTDSKSIMNRNNIVYDAMLTEIPIKSNATVQDEIIADKDLWLFDNTFNEIKTRTDEPFLKYKNDTIEIMSKELETLKYRTDPNIAQIKEAIEKKEGGTLIKLLTDSNEDVGFSVSNSEYKYVTDHYNQMSRVNENLVNMWLLGGLKTGENELLKNRILNLNQDYAIITFNQTNKEDIPKLILHLDYKYEGNMKLNIPIKLEPLKINDVLYYVIHRNDSDFNNLIKYSFDGDVRFTQI